jgi:hypothetical protein
VTHSKIDNTATVVSGLSRGVEMQLVSDITNFGWKYNVREADMRYRTVLLERWSIDDGRRSVDEKMEQLKVW